MNSDEFDDLVSGLSELTDATLHETALSHFDLRRLLRFLSKVVQVAEQAFQDVLATMIEFKYVSQSDKATGRLGQLQKELELLRARSRYRDAEEISSRLHHLRGYYHSEIEPITENLSNRWEWWHIFAMLDVEEGYIMMLVNNSVYELQGLLDEPDIMKINSVATHRVEEIRDSLSQLRSLNSQILGLSGTAGLLELTEEKVSERKADLNVNMGGVYNIAGQVGAIGPNAHAHNMTFAQLGDQIARTIDLEKLSKDLAQLRQTMKKEAITPEQDIAVSEIAKAEQAAKAKDSLRVAENLKAAGKWALDIAVKISVPVAVEALKQAIGIK